MVRIDRPNLFRDSMGGGAWPFLVSGVICLVNSDNERDPNHLTSFVHSGACKLLRGTMWKQYYKEVGL